MQNGEYAIWFSNIERLYILSFLLSAADIVNHHHQSDTRKVLTLIKDLAHQMGEDLHFFYPPLFIKLELERMMSSLRGFIWFKALPGVHYFIPTNTITTIYLYDTPIEEESHEYTNFRVNGCPLYVLLMRVFKQHGLRRIDFNWVLCKIQFVGDDAWADDPVERIANDWLPIN